MSAPVAVPNTDAPGPSLGGHGGPPLPRQLATLRRGCPQGDDVMAGEPALLARIRADGAAAAVPADERGAPDAAFVAGRIRAAIALPKDDPARIVAVFSASSPTRKPGQSTRCTTGR